MDYKAILEKYSVFLNEFRAHGASETDARSLAAAAAVADSQSPNSLGQYQSLKLSSDAVAYGYRGLTLSIAKLEFTPKAKGILETKLEIHTKIGAGTGKAKFKGDQAFRILTLVIGKFKEFECDLTKGFDRFEIANLEDYIEKKLKLAGLAVERPDHDAYEITRAIRNKLQENLNLSNLLVGPDSLPGHRLDLPPNNIAFSDRALKTFEDLFDSNVNRWYRIYLG